MDHTSSQRFRFRKAIIYGKQIIQNTHYLEYFSYFWQRLFYLESAETKKMAAWGCKIYTHQTESKSVCFS